MKFKNKIMLLCVVPILLALLLVVITVRLQTNAFVQNQLAALENQIMDEKQREITNYVELAMASIQSFLDFDPTKEAEVDAAKQSIELILNNMTFEDDGYFFVYDLDGTNIVHPLQPWRVGKNWLDLQDGAGKYVIQDLIERTNEGGGFELYVWERPSTHENGDKYAYVVPIEQLGWMLGTGIYVDSVRAQVDAMRGDISDRVRQLYWVTSAILGLSAIGVGTYLSLLVYRETSLADIRLHALNNDMISAQEEERRRVSRELHDGISQILVTAKHAFALSQTRVKNKKETHTEAFDEGFDLIDEAVSEVRRISQDLRPKALDDLGLAAALKMLVSRFENNAGIKASISVNPVNDALSDDKKSAIYRIAQEALTNIERHSLASKVTVELYQEQHYICMRINDDGIGLSQVKQQNLQNFGYGLGIANMEERLAKFDGKLVISTLRDAPDRGTSLLVKMPVEKNAMIFLGANQGDANESHN